jgi:diacylglycerol kinase (ATP)
VTQPADPHDDVSEAPLIVVNPRAARLHDAKRRTDIIAAVVRAVRARTGQAPIVLSGGMAAAQAALVASEGAPLVVAVGGDGTIRQAAAALAGRSTMLGVVPGGTGNVLAGSFGIRGIGPALDVIRHGEPRTMDLGVARWGSPGIPEPANEAIFTVACGMGLDARIMAAAEHEWKRRVRFGAYLGAAIKEVARLRPVDFRIDADGERLEIRGFLAMVANAGELVPGRIGPRRRIDPTDGRLDLIVVGGGNPVAGLYSVARLISDRGDLDGSVIRRTVETVRIESQPPEPIEIDGDHEPPGWLEVRTRPGVLRVLTSLLA